MTSTPLALILAACLGTSLRSGDHPPDQIAWIGDLDAARTIAEEQQRPLFLAVNMDGESASERIVRELYKDESFVALTRRAVCVVSSLFRHTPRDYDEDGAPIPCPRLGVVTCGEHIALEPLKYDAYLGGDRIAPRHALIHPDGTKVFDLSLLFDLDDVAARLKEELGPWPDPRPWIEPPTSELATLRALAARATNDVAMAQLVRSAREVGLAEETALELLRIHRDVRAIPPRWPDRQRLVAIAGLSTEPWSRSMILADRLLGGAAGAEHARRAVVARIGDEAARVERWAASQPVVDGWRWLEFAEAVRREVGIDPAPPRPTYDESELMDELSVATRAIRDGGEGDADANARLGRTALRIARGRIDREEAGADVFLVDAQRFLDSARALRPGDVTLWNDSAQVAYLQSRFDDEEQLGIGALRSLAEPAVDWLELPLTDAARLLADRTRHEALRWVGDASARLLAARSGGDAVLESAGILRGGQALMLAAASPRGDEVDWQSVTSFFAALGLVRLELAWLDAGLRRFPESNALRAALNNAIWRVGRPELAVDHAARMVEEFGDRGTSHWYLGFARVLLGDWRRREEAPDAAIELYKTAERDFDRCVERNPEFQGSCDFYRALCSMSRGFAHLLADRQLEAADCLVEAIRRDPGIGGIRDGLDREALDLVDASLEWRVGRPSPVDGGALIHRLYEGDPGSSAWARAIADTGLREGLRADGREDHELAYDYLARSIEWARRAIAIHDDEQNRRTLSQSATVYAELLLQRGRPEDARPHLVTAAPPMGLTAPSSDATEAELTALAAELRAMLGEPRPVTRPGR